MPLIVTPGQLTHRAEFYYQLSQLTSAGIGLVQALDQVQKNPPARSYREPVLRLISELAQGFTFSEAIQRIGPWLPEFDTTLISYCNGADPDSGVRRMYASDNIGNIPFSNAAAYRNAEVDRLFALGAETDKYTDRALHYVAAQQIIVRDLPYWWLVETVATAAWRSRFEEFHPWSGQFAERAWMHP